MKEEWPWVGFALADFAWGHFFVLLDANADWGWSYPTDAMERCCLDGQPGFFCVECLECLVPKGEEADQSAVKREQRVENPVVKSGGLPSLNERKIQGWEPGVGEL